MNDKTVHTMTRLQIPTGIGFDTFRAAFEAAVPGLDPDDITALITTSATWSEVCTGTARLAPHEFVLFHTIDAAPLMSLAGHDRPCVEYLMGNHTIAERMYRHDPVVMLYAPLRILLYADEHGQAVFVLDQPSTVMASFDNADITAVGRELDNKVAKLLEHLNVPVPTELAD